MNAPKNAMNINALGTWALTHNSEVIEEGSFTRCWDYLMDNHSNLTMKQFKEQGWKIGRID